MEVKINDERALLQLPNIHAMLKNAYWCVGITIDEISKSIDNSTLVVGAYDAEAGQVGFMRVISDKTRFAYILDVIVDEKFRHRGIATKMLKYALDHEELRDVYQWLLLTKDAHGVYKKLGFDTPPFLDRFMMIRKERPDRKDFKY